MRLRFSIGPRAYRVVACLFVLLFASTTQAAEVALAATSASYFENAARARRAHDRPWSPSEGQLGNLRHLQITARDCVVRVVSGRENRVFPGTMPVIAVEKSRVLDTDPNEQPTPRDIVLAPDHAQACPGVGSCGLTVTSVTDAPRIGGKDDVCFTVELATAHDMLIGGDGLTLLFDRLQQPMLRLYINPSARINVWFQQVQMGFLSIDANAPARVGGSGRVDLLSASSSNRASAMYLQGFDAKRVGISTTTTGTTWAIRIGDQTSAGYYQPARAPGKIAKEYRIEIDGPLDRLEVPAGSVTPVPLSDATREATRKLRDDVLQRFGPMPALPPSDPAFPLAKDALGMLPLSGRERVAQVVSRYLPKTVEITEVALWKKGGRLEGTAPDAATARGIAKLLEASGEFTAISGGGGTAKGDRFAFSVQMHFSCEAPGEPSECPAAVPPGSTEYTIMQVRDTLRPLLAPDATFRDLSYKDGRYHLQADAANEAQARAALDRISKGTRLVSSSVSGIGPPTGGPTMPFETWMELVCPKPPRPDGICVPAESP